MRRSIFVPTTLVVILAAIVAMVAQTSNPATAFHSGGLALATKDSEIIV